MDSELIDLHIHTSASDGTYSPQEIVDLAKKQGLKAIAITDHDTIEGNKDAIEAGMKKGMEVIPGVEISVEWNKKPVHILGYYINWKNEKLSMELQKLIKFREERNPQIIKKLNLLGLSISYDDVKMRAGEGTIGRPHFAQVLIEKGYVKNEDEAIDTAAEMLTQFPEKALWRGNCSPSPKKIVKTQKKIDMVFGRIFSKAPDSE